MSLKRKTRVFLPLQGMTPWPGGKYWALESSRFEFKSQHLPLLRLMSWTQMRASLQLSFSFCKMKMPTHGNCYENYVGKSNLSAWFVNI